MFKVSLNDGTTKAFESYPEAWAYALRTHIINGRVVCAICIVTVLGNVG